MAILDQEGLFYGERLRRCSDKAQLFFPRFILAANGFGRVNLDYNLLLKGPLASLHNPPSKKEVLEMFREYKEQYLAFPYIAENGELWAQWDVPQRLLRKYQTAADRRSPSPPEKEYREWQAEYIEQKKSRTVDLLDYEVVFSTSMKSTISENFQTTSNHIEPCQTTSIGVGVGVGNGVGKGEAKSKPVPELPEYGNTEFNSGEMARVVCMKLRLAGTQMLNLVREAIDIVVAEKSKPPEQAGIYLMEQWTAYQKCPGVKFRVGIQKFLAQGEYMNGPEEWSGGNGKSQSDDAIQRAAAKAAARMAGGANV